MFKIIVLAVIGYFGFKLYKKHKAPITKFFTKVNAAFSDGSDESNESVNTKNETNVNDRDIAGNAVPDNVRRDILDKQYMVFYEAKDSVSDKKDKVSKDVPRNEESESDEALKHVNNHTVFADKNGEIHTMLDLISAPVNQVDSSEREYNYTEKISKPKQHTIREDYRKHYVEAAKKASTNKTVRKHRVVKQSTTTPVQAEDLINQVKARLNRKK